MLAAGASAGCGSGDASEAAETTAPAQLASLVDAVDAAGVEIGGVSDGEVEDLIQAICDDTTSAEQLADGVVALVDQPGDARQVIEGAGDGAELYCPKTVAASPHLLQDSYTAAVALLAAQQPATTQPAHDGPGDHRAADDGATASSHDHAPPPPPPTTQPASVYYENCTAARSAGAAPVHRGEPGYGSHLDRDGDGIGCES